MNVPEAVAETLREGRSFVIATHSPVDGDALGSCLALHHSLRAAGRESVVVIETYIPSAYRFLAGADELLMLDDAASVPEAEVLVGLDAGPDRLGRAYQGRANCKKFLNIDHHISNLGDAGLAWVEPEASATGEMLLPALEAAGLPVTTDVAEALLTAIVTDTGRFCYSCTTAHTFEVAASLVRRGANPDRIYQALFNSTPLPVLALKSRAVEGIELRANGELGLLTVDAGIGQDLGVREEHVKDLIDVVNGVAGVVVAVLIRGLTGGGTKVSLRSNHDLADVAAFAAKHGGGGHRRAAGFSADVSPAELRSKLLVGLEELVAAAR